ncbi:MAG: 3-isopropylmalate dehydratase small subunit [Candidatus Marinimicrobia bacterium]|nr:3-isopropylmalate dehydratase small subunit [Candidatus Neomarinimicrobiota bacterium]
MSIKGRVWKYGDDINTDVIFPGKYTYTVSDPNEMAQYAMEDLDSEFAKNVKENDIIVGGKNFGCGSGREQAVVCIKMSGVGVIIAKSFSRLYFRNCVNNGLYVIVSAEAVDAIENGEEIEVDMDNGTIVCGAGTISFPPLPPEVRGIFEDGGLIPHTKKILGTD